MAVICGVPDDDGISQHNKCVITQHIDGQEVTVTGYMTEDCQMSIRAQWGSPFEGDTVGGVAGSDKLSSLGQVMSEKTSKTLLNTAQVWEGNEPPEISMTLRFVAYSDAKSQVNDPIRYLCQMASPEVEEEMPLGFDGLSGRVPAQARFEIGQGVNILMRISEVSYNVNAPKTKDGYYAYNTVTITAAPKMMINKSQIPQYIK